MAAQDEPLKVYIEGRKYELDDFKLGELEWLEDELGGLGEANLLTMKAAIRFITVIKRRENPEFSVDDARAMDLNVFDEPDPPTEAPKSAGSKRGKSGETSSPKT